MSRFALLTATAVLGVALCVSDTASARGDGQASTATSASATNGAVVHGVDTKLLTARLREIDLRLVEGDGETAARGLASLATADLSPLVEEGEGVWISAEEGTLQRAAQLAPEALVLYRSALDPLAESALQKAMRHGDASALARDAARLAFTTRGPDLLLLLADLRLSRGDLGGSARALEDLLRLLTGRAPARTIVGAASRLAALQATAGDAPAVRGLAKDLPDTILDEPSPLGEGTLRDELTRAAAIAAERAGDPDPGPKGEASVVAEVRHVGSREFGVGPAGREPGTLREEPLPIGTAESPALLVRLTAGMQSRVLAIAPAPAEPQLPGEPKRTPPFLRLWIWPSSTSEDARRSVEQPFAPVRVTSDLVLFTWPAPPGDLARGEDRFSDAGEERHQLVLLSLSTQGKLADERGRSAETETERADGDPELPTLSFCGRPAVDGRAVYATAVRRAEKSDATELHLCRFDFVPEGRAGRLVLRWRRHLLDGPPIPPALFKVHESIELMPRVTLPSPPLVRAGRVFVASNTGAVACVDAASGRPEWVETYRRFGPSQRTTVRETELESWDEVPLAADGPFLYAAPRDCESLVQFRRAPRGARSARVEEFAFSAPNGTALRASRLLPNLVPTRLAGVRDGVAYLAGRVAQRPFGATRMEEFEGSPLAAFELGLDARRALLAQVQEYAAAGPPVLLRDALLFPSPKAIYRVPLDDFEAPPEVLWRHAGGGDTGRGQDRIGVLVPDGERLWTVTPSRILLLEASK